MRPAANPGGQAMDGEENRFYPVSFEGFF